MFCSIEDCGRRVYSRDLCEIHYRRLLRNGDPDVVKTKPGQKTCAVHGCRKKVDARGLCHGHYQRLMRGSELTDEAPLSRRKFDPKCSVESCGRPTSAKGLCKTHLTRLQKYGDVRAEVPIIPKVGYHMNHGYRIVSVPAELRHLTNGAPQEAEHRLIMAIELDRPLRPDESVHHKNGNKLDNRACNLELWSRYQPRGQRIEDKVAFAREILNRYGDGEAGT